MKKQCYNCGKSLPLKNQRTKEHIPARNLFQGYNEEYKKQRITVTSCYSCNQKYANTIDGEFRDWIGLMYKHKEHQAINENTLKYLKLNFSKVKDRFVFDRLGNFSGFHFNLQDIGNYHKKNFKGIFTNQYNEIFPTNWFINIFMDAGEEFVDTCISYLTRNFDWNKSGHKDVFRYILQPLRLNEVNYEIRSSLEYQNQDKIYLCLMTYNDAHSCLVVATDNSILVPENLDVIITELTEEPPITHKLAGIFASKNLTNITDRQAKEDFLVDKKSEC